MNPTPKKADAKIPQPTEQPINLAQKALSAASSTHGYLQDSSKSVFTTLRLPTPPRSVVGSIISPVPSASQIISANKPSPRHVVTTTVYPVMSLGGSGTPVPMASIIRGPMPQTISAHSAAITQYSSHIPRGPAAVASISAGPKSAVATPILRPTHALQQMTVRAPTLNVNRPATNNQQATLAVSHIIDRPKSSGSLQISRALDTTVRTTKPMHLSQVQQIGDKGFFKAATVLQPRTCASTCVVTIAPAPTTAALRTTVVSSKTVVIPPKTPDAAKKGVVVASSAAASIPVAKVHPQPSAGGENARSGSIFIAHPSPAVVLSSSENRSDSVRFASLSRPATYAVPQAAYFYESYPMQNTMHSYSAASSPASLRPTVSGAPIQSVPPTHPVMVTVDSFGTSASETTTHYTAAGGYSGHTNHNTSPRPSILRKRASDGVSAVKKNLLASLPGPTSPHPEIPSPKPLASESQNGCVEQPEQNVKMEPTTDANEIVASFPVETSPRKKPRKQQLAATELLESHSTDGEEAYESVKREEDEQQQKCVTFCKRPSMSLLNSYRHTWKSRHNHFLRYTDVKPKDDKKCTVNELANQKGVIQKTNGWKIYHLTTQLDHVADLESSVHERLSGLLDFVEASPPWKAPLPSEEEKTLVKVSDLIKGNLQRSKIAQDQVSEMKQQVVRMLEHKAKVIQIIGKYVSKRPIKKKNN